MKTRSFLLPIALMLLCTFNAFSTTHNVSITGMAFSPSTLTINVGDKVIWTNNDGMTHTVTQGTNCTNSGFDSGNIANGATYEHTFTTAGTVTYFCKLHCTMVGTITVSTPTDIDSKAAAMITEIKTFPNPFNINSEIQINLEKSGKVKIEVYDMYGHKLMEIADEEKHSGVHSFVVQGESLRDGIFICKIFVNGHPAASEYIVKKAKSE